MFRNQKRKVPPFRRKLRASDLRLCSSSKMAGSKAKITLLSLHSLAFPSIKWADVNLGQRLASQGLFPSLYSNGGLSPWSIYLPAVLRPIGGEVTL